MPKQAPQRRKISAAAAALPEEVARFNDLAADWWDEKGALRALHWMNPPRLEFIRGHLAAHFRLDPASPRPLAGLRILDIGCGGGLLAEPLARMGAQVTGIDAAADAVTVARRHAGSQGLAIDYRKAETGDLCAAGESFDAVCALEIIEHVADPAVFVREAVQLTRPGGMLFFSTLNRTVKSLALGIVAAEYILGLAPRGAHDWRKFLRPSELARMAEDNGCITAGLAGMAFDPFGKSFNLSQHHVDINYIIAFKSPVS